MSPKVAQAVIRFRDQSHYPIVPYVNSFTTLAKDVNEKGRTVRIDLKSSHADIARIIATSFLYLEGEKKSGDL